MQPRHAQSISSVYEKVIALALVVNAALFAVYVMLPRAHGKAPLDEAQSEEVRRIGTAAAGGGGGEDLRAESRTRVIDCVRAAFDPYVHGSEVRFTAACWMFGAQASSASPALKGAARV